ncbi:MAG: nucleotide exchange factor GrpE [Vicinamibacterales bacterium]
MRSTGEEEQAEQQKVDLLPAAGEQEEADGRMAGSQAGSVEAAPEADSEALRRERDSYRDRLLRTAAEFENYKKRVDRERRDFQLNAAADVFRGMLPIVDDLERALDAPAPPEAEPYRKGVEIIHKQMLELLRHHGVTPIEAVGTEFDPHLHEAVVTEQTDEYPEGQVISELQRGYRLGERLLRPAMVKVARA